MKNIYVYSKYEYVIKKSQNNVKQNVMQVPPTNIIKFSSDSSLESPEFQPLENSQKFEAKENQNFKTKIAAKVHDFN